MELKDYIRVIPDFPKEGIQFKDITTLLNNGVAYSEAIGRLVEYSREMRVDVFASPEARGFVVGAPLAFA